MSMTQGESVTVANIEKEYARLLGLQESYSVKLLHKATKRGVKKAQCVEYKYLKLVNLTRVSDFVKVVEKAYKDFTCQITLRGEAIGNGTTLQSIRSAPRRLSPAQYMTRMLGGDR